MAKEERTKRVVSFDQIPSRQRASLEAQLPKKASAGGCCGCLVILLVIGILFKLIFGGDDGEKSSKPIESPATQSQQIENNKSKSEEKTEQPKTEEKSKPPELGKNWIKDHNDVYMWNPQPTEGESITWSGGYIQDGDYRYADGSGITTWYIDGNIEQVDEGTFEHGQRHGQFTHKFPSGRIIYSNWDHGIKINETDSDFDDIDAAQQTFINYHKAITNKHYREAYDILSSNQKQRVGDFNTYTAGFVDTISSEVSDMMLMSSDDDSYTFDYTLTARDRYQGNRVKVQIFKGQVTMAKDKGRWYVRHAKSSKVNESFE